MKKIAALALSLLMAVSLLAGCGQKSPADQRKAKNEIAVGIAQDLGSSLDPRSLASAGAREVLFNVFEGLYKPTSSGDFVPALATDCQVTDEGKTYTFTLREGVKFHNGKTMTADDVVYTFKSYAESSTDSNLKAALGAMADVKADGNKVIVTLTEANSDFMAYVASIHVIPSDYAEQETKPVGTGPFRYESRSVQESIVLVRNDDYYGTKAKVSKVTYKIYETGTALVTALAGGAVDIVAHMTEQQVKGLSKDYTVLEGTMNLVQALYLNNAEGPLADVRVRQALCYAVDVQNMLDLTAGGMLNRFVSGSSKNISNFASAEYDALIAEASSITDDARRTECYRAAEKILSDEAANVYLQDMADFVAIRSTLDGYHFYPLYVMDLSTVGYK